MSTLLRNFRLTGSTSPDLELLIENGLIAAVGRNLNARADHVIDCGGNTLMPGFVDLHAHFRDPGQTQKEDIFSGCLAAARGGYTTVHLMPNTKPVCSTHETVDYVLERAKQSGNCRVVQSVSITKNFDGKTLSHLDDLHPQVKWLTDDGFGVAGTETILAAMHEAKVRGVGLMLHEEDSALSGTDTLLAEDLMTFRDVQLAELTGCQVHFCHVSTINAMQYIIDGKQRGINITCEVTPHHLALNDETTGKVNPPLRGEEHRCFLIQCVKNGLVDAIATDHAPHTAQDKTAGANGFIGLETAFAVCYTHLVKPGHITLHELSRLMSENPAHLLGLDAGRIEPGFAADLVLVNPDSRFTVTGTHFASKSNNSPFTGIQLQGEVLLTLREGRIVYEKTD